MKVLLLADQVYRDDVSGKFHVNGTRSSITADSFPLNHPAFMIYAVLSDGRGETTRRFRLIDLDEEREPVADEEMVIEFVNPPAEYETIGRWTDLVFPEPGDYRLQLLAYGQLPCERRLTLGEREVREDS